MDEIEQLLEGGKAEAAAQRATTAQSPSNGHRDYSGDEVRTVAPCLLVAHSLQQADDDFANSTYSIQAGQVGT